MAINLCCPVCYKTYKLQTLKCKCGNNLKRNQLFKVRIKLPDGKWKSKQVNSLELAKKVEAKFKTQSIEETVFNIHKAPVIDFVWGKYLQWARLNKRSWLDDRISDDEEKVVFGPLEDILHRRNHGIVCRLIYPGYSLTYL